MTRPTVLAGGRDGCVDIQMVEKTFRRGPRCLLLLRLPLSRKGESRGFGLRVAKRSWPAPGLSSSGGVVVGHCALALQPEL